MDLGLKGRTALVCGASSGLGLASAEALAAEGANVTMFARRRDELEREADRIGALAVRGDVTLPQDLERAVATTLEAFGGLDILVWNSGGPPAGRGADVTPDSLEQAVELMLQPRVRLVRARAAAPGAEPRRPHRRDHLARREGADRAPRALEHVPPRVTGWLKTLADELGPQGITVNCVAPGRIATRAARPALSRRPDRGAARARSRCAAGATPREFGDVVCFLASDRARYVTGQTIVVDGGLQRALF